MKQAGPGCGWQQGQGPAQPGCPGAAARTQALIGALRRRSPPGPVVEERKALLTVHPKGVVLAVAYQLPKLILHTLTCMPVAFAPGSGEVRNRY